MEFSFNWLAILAATLSAFVVGFLWYGPLLGKAWMVLLSLPIILWLRRQERPASAR